MKQKNRLLNSGQGGKGNHPLVFRTVPSKPRRITVLRGVNIGK